MANEGELYGDQLRDHLEQNVLHGTEFGPCQDPLTTLVADLANCQSRDIILYCADQADTSAGIDRVARALAPAVLTHPEDPPSDGGGVLKLKLCLAEDDPEAPRVLEIGVIDLMRAACSARPAMIIGESAREYLHEVGLYLSQHAESMNDAAFALDSLRYIYLLASLWRQGVNNYNLDLTDEERPPIRNALLGLLVRNPFGQTTTLYQAVTGLVSGLFSRGDRRYVDDDLVDEFGLELPANPSEVETKNNVFAAASEVAASMIKIGDQEMVRGMPIGPRQAKLLHFAYLKMAERSATRFAEPVDLNDWAVDIDESSIPAPVDALEQLANKKQALSDQQLLSAVLALEGNVTWFGGLDVVELNVVHSRLVKCLLDCAQTPDSQLKILMILEALNGVADDSSRLDLYGRLYPQLAIGLPLTPDAPRLRTMMYLSQTIVDRLGPAAASATRVLAALYGYRDRYERANARQLTGGSQTITSRLL